MDSICFFQSNRDKNRLCYNKCGKFKFFILCLFALTVSSITGCGALESRRFPGNPVALKSVEVPGLNMMGSVNMTGVEYNGRIYVDYGSMKYIRKKDISGCIGYVEREDYPDDKDDHIYTIAGDDENDYLIEYYVSGIMEEAIVLRAVDTVGETVRNFDFIDYYGLWTNNFWDMGVDVTGGKVVSEYDSHGGFHGDGLSLVEIQFYDDTALEHIKKSKYWKELPLTDNLEEFIYEPLDDQIKIPRIENGYYYFYDRHDDSSDPYDDKELLGRHSLNFTVMIYDSDSGKMYICQEDT